jgi:hypothetical protein
MPEEWPVDMTEVHIKNNSYQFDFTPVVNGNHIIIKYFFKSFRDFIPTGDFSQYKTDYKEISKCLSLFFYKKDFLSPLTKDKNVKPEGNTNWIAVWISFFVAVLLTSLFNHLNKRSLPSEGLVYEAPPLNGVIILLGITLIIRFIFQGYNFLDEHYYMQTVWNQLGISAETACRSFL